MNSRTAPILRGVLLSVSTVAAYVTHLWLFVDTDSMRVVIPLWPALPLLGILIIGSLRPRSRSLRLALPVAEAAAIGLVLAQFSDHPFIEIYAWLLLVPVFVAGQRAGLFLALTASAAGALAWLSGLTSVESMTDVELLATHLQWALTMAMTAMVSAWIQRLVAENRPTDDVSAYLDAFRLLSELQHVARNLSLGLDPVTLATTLVDDLRDAAPGAKASVAIRGPEGRFAPMVGHMDAGDHAVASQAWLSSVTTASDADGEHRLALPVLMGERVIAIATLGGIKLDPGQRDHTEGLVRVAGPRLAAALLFDEVRQLATVDERLRLAREIHDGIAQELASLGYMLDDLAERVPADAAEEVRLLREHVRRVTGELRLSIFDLRAGVDDEVTLGAALVEHVQRVAAASRLVAHTMIDEQGDRLPTATEIELLRIAQEALTNIRKHAQASNVWIECIVDAPDVLVRVIDDGVGLQPARPGAMGLRGMRERARRIGGTLTVFDRDGGGTVIEVRFGDPAHKSHLSTAASIA